MALKPAVSHSLKGAACDEAMLALNKTIAVKIRMLSSSSPFRHQHSIQKDHSPISKGTQRPSPSTRLSNLGRLRISCNPIKTLPADSVDLLLLPGVLEELLSLRIASLNKQLLDWSEILIGPSTGHEARVCLDLRQHVSF
jgi:hypothetical protein